MMLLFLISAGVAVVSAVLAITRTQTVHTLLLMTVSLISTALIFFILGAPFAAALEIIIYAGAIMVLLLFVIMLINPEFEGSGFRKEERALRAWFGPLVLVLLLLAELGYLAFVIGNLPEGGSVIQPKQVSITLFQRYLLGVELASFLLLAGLIGAYHIGRRRYSGEEKGGEGG
jgi:NADH-quinone oxidoreductase subunit J